MAKDGKYSHINFKPPEGVASAAARGLELRKKASPSNKGGLTSSEASKEGVGSGVQRATNLKNRDELSPETVRQMANFLSRSTAVMATLFLLIAGGLVTSAREGLAVVDWPNSFGYNMFLYPPSRMTGGIYYERAHRLFGSLVGLTVLVLADSYK